MPHTVTPSGNGLLRKFTGLVTNTEYQSAVETLYSSQNFEDLSYVINDFTDATLNENFIEAIDYSAAFFVSARLTNRRFRLAYVTTNKEIAQEIKESFAISGFGEKIVKVCENLELAEEFVHSRHS